MTDTTAPDAITQAFYAEATDGDALLPGALVLERDGFERAHRHLAAHGAGEGLREALEWYGEQARLARLIHSEGDAGRNALAADGGKRALKALYGGASHKPGCTYNFIDPRCHCALLTPPTDAGSTTREGGEGVEALWKRACEGREGYCSSDLQDAARWAIGEAFRLAERAARSATLPPGYQWSDGNREKFDFGRDTAADAIAALATTSSPDASPDSGEAEQIIRQLRETGPKNFHNGTEWVGKPHNRDGEAAAQLIERLLVASPARLSGGAGFCLGSFVEKKSGSSWRGQIVGSYSTSLTPVGWAVESSTETGSVQIYPEKALRLAPFPEAPAISTFVRGGESLFEAPANRQGTCTCNGAGQWPLVELVHAPGCPRGPANRQEAGEVEKLKALLKKERQRATDALYMRDAYRQMLGPKGQQVADTWDAAGLVRVHVSWGPDAALLDGEGIAQAHLDMAEAAKTGTPIEDVDGHIATLTSPKDVKGGGR